MARLLRNVGNLLGGGGDLGQAIIGGGAGVASYETGDPRYMALPLAGLAAKKLSGISTAWQARKLDEMVRARSPLAAEAAANAPTMPPYARDPILRLVANQVRLAQSAFAKLPDEND